MGNNINVGSINGGNNQFNQNNQNNYNIKNVNHNGGGGGDQGGQGVTIVVAVFVAMVVTAFLYLRHFEQIFFLLLISVAITGALHTASLFPLWRDPGEGYWPLLHTLIGVSLTGAQAWVVIKAFNTLPAEVLDIANRPTTAPGLVPQAMEVWGRFSNYGQRIITENLATVLCVAPAIVLNALYALQHLLTSMAGSGGGPYSSVADRMYVCKSRGAPVSVFLTIAASLAISGILLPASS